ncbi:hypothetical protein Vadar_005655 [Vaccinium darrowii]|uniref:Uncharacterized protein n=1 Tax=Vaccinium darrowii TaxID=229202 RepID=A0ACB7XX09_9ERIC|nr:hypothetical protein Vadar_005655 [Vaccinium darrowii]
MERSDAAQPISITLDGTNYVLWAQAMSSFIKGKKLWRIITGDVVKPIKGDTETQPKYDERLDDWDNKNHLIITWCRNTSVTSINLQFGHFQNVDGPAKAIWDFLKERYSTTGLAHQYQLLSLLHLWSDTDDAQKFTEYRDQQRLILFLMALTSDFEPVRASFLHRNPLPTLEQAISELLSEETRLGTTKSQRLDVVLATHQTRIGSSAPNSNLCRYCHSPDHQLLYCPVRICKHCLKPGKGHYQEDCYKNPDRRATGNSGSKGGQYKSGNWAKPTIASRTAAAEGSPSTIPFPPDTYSPVSKSDIEVIVKQVLLNSGTPSSTTLSMTSSSSSWFFNSACCNHMTFDSTLFSSKSSSANTHVVHTADGSHMHFHLHSLNLTSFFTDSSVELFPDDELDIGSPSELLPMATPEMTLMPDDPAPASSGSSPLSLLPHLLLRMVPLHHHVVLLG